MFGFTLNTQDSLSQFLIFTSDLMNYLYKFDGISMIHQKGEMIDDLIWNITFFGDLIYIRFEYFFGYFDFKNKKNFIMVQEEEISMYFYYIPLGLSQTHTYYLGLSLKTFDILLENRIVYR